ncbi:MAG: type IX secretion system protein PorQ [Bacteroidia bacterium]
MKKILIIIGLLGCISSANAQIGGRNVYDFLNLTPTGRLVALGGVNVSTMDDDPNQAAQNPALLNDSMHNHLSLSFSNYLAGIVYGYTSYAYHKEGIGTFHAGVQYVNYGKMIEADPFGNITGEFGAGEVAVILGYGSSWKQLSFGANWKFISSTIAPGYNSTGIAIDLGGAYRSKDKLFSAGVTVRNLGAQLSTYAAGGVREPLPFEVIAGISQKLRYMPLRFSITATNLDIPRLIYKDPNPEQQFDLAGNPIDPPNQTVDLIFRHFVFGGEFLLGKALRIRGGYNHLRRQELRSANRAGMTGFSLGAGIRISRLAFDYGFASYGANNLQTHQFSLTYKLGASSAPITP